MFRSTHILYGLLIAVVIIIILQWKESKLLENIVFELKNEMSDIKKNIVTNETTISGLVEKSFGSVGKSLQSINNNVLTHSQSLNRNILTNLQQMNTISQTHFTELSTSLNKLQPNDNESTAPNSPKGYNYMDINSTLENQKIDQSSTVIDHNSEPFADVEDNLENNKNIESNDNSYIANNKNEIENAENNQIEHDEIENNQIENNQIENNDDIKNNENNMEDMKNNENDIENDMENNDDMENDDMENNENDDMDDTDLKEDPNNDNLDEETKLGIEKIISNENTQLIDIESKLVTNYNIKQLRSIAKEKNISMSGTKLELYDRLNELNAL
jgi:hypothetical protein